MSRFLLPLLVLLVSAPAYADSLPSCAPGTHMVVNPTPPGSMHHGGASCVADDEATPPVNPPPPATPPAATTPPATAPASAAAPASETTSGGMCSVGLGRVGSPALFALTLIAGLMVLSRRR